MCELYERHFYNWQNHRCRPELLPRPISTWLVQHFSVSKFWLSGSRPSPTDQFAARLNQSLQQLHKSTNQSGVFDVHFQLPLSLSPPPSLSHLSLQTCMYFPLLAHLSPPTLPSLANFFLLSSPLHLTLLFLYVEPLLVFSYFFLSFFLSTSGPQTDLTSACSLGRECGSCGEEADVALFYRRVNPRQGVSRWALFEALHSRFS